jgi:hypothetical protein
VTLEAERTLIRPIVLVALTAVTGQHVAVNDSVTDEVALEIEKGSNTISLTYPSLPLRPGVYSINVSVSERFMTNLLLMDIGRASVEVSRRAQDHGAGFLSLKPAWHVSRAGVAID